MQLIEDLGMRPVGTQGRRARFGLYECPVCYKYFEVRASDDKSGHTTKCRSCASSATALLKSNVAKATIIDRFSEVHGNIYDYSLVEYTSALGKVTIICLKHGIFEQIPSSHLKGKGCPTCATEAIVSKAKATVITRFKEVHGNTYDYSLVNYTRNKFKVKILCSTHGAFEQSPNVHLSGHGCPKCAISGFQKTKPGILYYLRVSTLNHGTLYKIGITNRTVNARFSTKELKAIEVVWTKHYDNGEDCYNEEQGILKEFQEFKYQGPPILTSGNTELLTTDILKEYICCL